MSDFIHIERLTVSAHLGVSDEERAQPQRVELSLTLPCPAARAAADDELALTVDYFQVCQTVRRVAAARPRRLLETLAENVAAAVLAEFNVGRVTVEARKFAIPDTHFVSVKIERIAAAAV